MVYFLLAIYFLNLFFAINLVLNTKYKLSYLNYTLLLIIALPILTPLIYAVIYFDEQIEKKINFNYQNITLQAKGEIFNNGETFFDDLIEEINKAKSSIIINLFIFNSDSIGKKIIKQLEEKQKQGVIVIIIYDYLARKKLKLKYLKTLKKLGAEIICFMPMRIFKRLNLNYRNHRKVIIIDQQIAYLGGFNIGDEYLSRNKLGLWSDIQIKLTGDMTEVINIVEEDLKLINHTLNLPKSNIEIKEKLDEYKLIPSGLEENRLSQTLFTFLDLIYHAKESIDIMTPYLVITDGLIDSLIYAATKGIKVTILIPAKNDHPLVNNATRAYALKLIHENIKIYLYSEIGFLHGKVIMIDQEQALITSANFDNRSCKYNLELGVLTRNNDIVKIINEQFKDKIADSKPFTKADCRNRDKLAQLFSTFM